MVIALLIRIAQDLRTWHRQYRVMDSHGMHYGFTRSERSARLQARILRGTYYRYSEV